MMTAGYTAAHMPESFPDRLRRERRTRGESQRTTAPRFGISQAGYARWELGENKPEPHHYDALASFLGCEVGDIHAMIYDSGEPPEAGAQLGQRVTNLEGRLETELRLLREELSDQRRLIRRVSSQLSKLGAPNSPTDRAPRGSR